MVAGSHANFSASHTIYLCAGRFILFMDRCTAVPTRHGYFILTAGATLGGIGAYWFSQRLIDEWVEKIENSHAYKLLHKQDNFFTLFALRVFPAFPHSLVNYSSGILKVKLSHFIFAAMLGIGIKSYIYADVIYSATTSASLNELMNISTYGPLLLLSVLTFVGIFIKYKWSKKTG